MTQEPGHSLRSRAPYLPIHKRPPLNLPGGARVAVWTIVNVEKWSIERDAAHGAAAADGPAAAARPAQLGLARVRHARGLLALPRGAGRARAQGDVCHQRLGLQALSARLPGGAGSRLGIHGPRLHPAADAPRRGPAQRHRRHHRGHSRLHRQAAARLGKPRPHRDLRHHRLAGRGGHRVRRRLGARRPAGARSRPRTARSSRCPTPSR